MSKIAQQFIKHLKINRSWVDLSGFTARQLSCICYLGNWRYLSYHGYSSFKIRLAIPHSPTYMTILKRKKKILVLCQHLYWDKRSVKCKFSQPTGQVKNKLIFLLKIFSSLSNHVIKSLIITYSVQHFTSKTALLLLGRNSAEIDSYHVAISLCIKVPHKRAAA